MKRLYILLVGLLGTICVYAQTHSNDNLWYNDGATVTIQAGTLVTVQGDITNNHSTISGTTNLDNNGFIWAQGNLYGDNAFKQTGTGTLRMQNKTPLYTAPYATESYQVIQGGYRINGGQPALAANDDGSLYNLELDNQAGFVFTKTNTDVRNAVDFKPASVVVDGSTIAPNGTTNRLLTYDSGTNTAPAIAPANGALYTAVFGMMNNATGMTNFKNVSTNLTANTTTLDNAYIQGKLRRAINATGGSFGFPLGLEPSTSATAARGIQYNNITFAANTYDVLTGYFQQGSNNSAAVGLSAGCGNAVCTYGIAHGEWVFTALIAGAQNYDMTIYPQDYTDPCTNLGQYAITKNDAFSGTGCGSTQLGLTRTGMSGFSEFGFASIGNTLPVKLVDFTAMLQGDKVKINWTVAEQIDIKNYEVEFSTDGRSFTTISNTPASLTNNYRSEHTNPVTGLNYYRLKIIDDYGKIEYSNVQLVRYNKDGSITIFPNPVSSQLNIMLSEAWINKKVQVELINQSGQIILSKEIKNTLQTEHLQLSNLVNGIYILKLKQDANTIYYQKIQVMK